MVLRKTCFGPSIDDGDENDDDRDGRGDGRRDIIEPSQQSSTNGSAASTVRHRNLSNSKNDTDDDGDDDTGRRRRRRSRSRSWFGRRRRRGRPHERERERGHVHDDSHPPPKQRQQDQEHPTTGTTNDGSSNNPAGGVGCGGRGRNNNNNNSNNSDGDGVTGGIGGSGGGDDRRAVGWWREQQQEQQQQPHGRVSTGKALGADEEGADGGGSSSSYGRSRSLGRPSSLNSSKNDNQSTIKDPPQIQRQSREATSSQRRPPYYETGQLLINPRPLPGMVASANINMSSTPARPTRSRSLDTKKRNQNQTRKPTYGNDDDKNSNTNMNNISTITASTAEETSFLSSPNTSQREMIDDDSGRKSTRSRSNNNSVDVDKNKGKNDYFQRFQPEIEHQQEVVQQHPKRRQQQQQQQHFDVHKFDERIAAIIAKVESLDEHEQNQQNDRHSYRQQQQMRGRSFEKGTGNGGGGGQVVASSVDNTSLTDLSSSVVTDIRDNRTALAIMTPVIATKTESKSSSNSNSNRGKRFTLTEFMDRQALKVQKRREKMEKKSPKNNNLKNRGSNASNNNFDTGTSNAFYDESTQVSHLSDVPSDCDSVTRERYLLACQMLKTTMIQKETSLVPVEKEYLLSLLGNESEAEDDAGDDGNDVGEINKINYKNTNDDGRPNENRDHSPYRRRQQQEPIETQPTVKKAFVERNVSRIPSNDSKAATGLLKVPSETAPRKMMTSPSTHSDPSSTISDKNPHTATRRLRQQRLLMALANNNPCGPRGASRNVRDDSRTAVDPNVLLLDNGQLDIDVSMNDESTTTASSFGHPSGIAGGIWRAKDTTSNNLRHPNVRLQSGSDSLLDDEEGDNDTDKDQILVRFNGWSFHQSYEKLPFRILGATDEGGNLDPRVLTPHMMEALRSFMPYNITESNYWLKYSLVRDGASIETLLANIRSSTYTVIAVETTHGEVFGSFTATKWRVGSKWFGNGEAFLWRMKKCRYTSPQNARRPAFEREMEVFPYTGYDDMVQYCTTKTIAVGGGDWLPSDAPSPFDSPSGIGFMIDGDLAGGETNSCSTFANPRLAKHLTAASSEFTIRNLEVWTMTSCGTVSEAIRLEENQRLIEDQHSGRLSRSTPWKK
eukprot:CAMPEP_0113446392 /NCGR_PEP_ID=MMETSP0014_2-20120614/3681_1 /TAXON_ID=2857 /ORGANISM="Nitzschia sp." /LENGTH=1120 /DNA_ID=CAMNT_0000337479 /DNA_START=39 /DNA_END=3401 /DNA_ORIENTATION=+ /assembly_acc=CAM_ASM_000159